MTVNVEEAPGRADIRPFEVEVPEADLADMLARIRAARFPDRETVTGRSQGPKLELRVVRRPERANPGR